jgi:hypothetical protein
MLDNLINVDANQEEINFYINDVGLFVAPTSISIHKEGMTYSSKTLRTNTSVKFGSGNGIYHVQLSLVFPPDSLVQLHRIIVQIKNNPFVYIENDFIKSSIDPLELNEPIKDRDNSLFFTCMGINVINHPSSPASFICEIDLRLFNEKAYSSRLEYKDDVTENIYKDQKLTEISFNIPFGDSEELNIINEFPINQSNSIRSYNKIFADKKNPTRKVRQPYKSKIYIRYSNWLQNYYLQDCFRINIFEILEEEYSKDEIKNILYNLKLGNLGLHNLFYTSVNLNKLRDNIIYQMLSHATFTQVLMRNFIEFNLNYELLKEIQDFINKNGLQGRAEQAKKLMSYFENNEAIENISDEEFLNNEFTSSLNLPLIDNLVHPNISYDFVSILPKISEETILNYKEDDFNLNIYHIKYANISINNIKVLSPAEGIISFKDNVIEIQTNNYGIIKYLNIQCTDNLKEFYKSTNYQVYAGSVVGFMKNNYVSVELLGKIKNKFESLKEVKNTFFKNSTKDKLNLMKEYTDYIKSNFDLYIERAGLENIFQNETNITFNSELTLADIQRLTGIKKPVDFEEPEFKNNNTSITSISGSLRHIMSSIPILGLEYPTHQFLGSIEPVYQINLLENNRLINEESSKIKRLEEFRRNGMFYIKNFPEIPDSNQLIVDSFITRLFGSYREFESFQVLDEETLKKKNFNISLDSMDTFTVDGSPNTYGVNLRLSESKSYNDENIKPAASNKLGDNAKKEIQKYFENKMPIYKESFFNSSAPVKNAPKASKIIPQNNDYVFMNWTSERGFFDAETFYQRPRSYKYSNKLVPFLQNFDNNEQDPIGLLYSPDKNLYALANLLDGIQNILNHYESPNNPGKVGYSINLFSTLRDYHIVPNSTSFKSAHKTGSAADTVVSGLNVMEFASICKYLIDHNHIIHPYAESRGVSQLTIGIGMYGANAHDINVKMSDRYAGVRGFVHIDLNPTVKFLNFPRGMLYNFNFNTKWNRLWFGKDAKDKFNPGKTVFEWWSQNYNQIIETIKPKLLEAIEKSKE